MKKLTPTKVEFQRFAKEFQSMEEANEFIRSNSNYRQGGIDVFRNGTINLTVSESKDVLFFPTLMAREEFIEKNTDFNVLGVTLYNGKFAAWVEPK